MKPHRGFVITLLVVLVATGIGRIGLSSPPPVLSSVDHFDRPDAPLALVALASTRYTADGSTGIDPFDALLTRKFVLASRAPTRATRPLGFTSPTPPVRLSHRGLWPRAPPSV